jgi:hypothetical protein
MISNMFIDQIDLDRVFANIDDPFNAISYDQDAITDFGKSVCSFLNDTDIKVI